MQSTANADDESMAAQTIRIYFFMAILLDWLRNLLVIWRVRALSISGGRLLLPSADIAASFAFAGISANADASFSAFDRGKRKA